MSDVKTFMVEDAQIIFRNFSGKESQYNREGDRNFACILEPDMAGQMLKDGWNVRYLKAREEGDEETPYIQIAVKFEIRPPRITQITSSGKMIITEDLVETLDWAEVRTVDLIARGYEWSVNGKSGVKAYLQSMFITIEEDALERKYAQMGTPDEEPF